MDRDEFVGLGRNMEEVAVRVGRGGEREDDDGRGVDIFYII